MISRQLEIAIKNAVQIASKEIFKQTDERLSRLEKETDKIMKETDKKIKKTTDLVDALTGKWGKFVESIVAPGAEKMFKERGIQVEQVATRVVSRKNGSKMEIDVFIANSEYVVLISVKSTLKIDDVNAHIKNLRNFKKFFPRYKNAKVIGAVAGIVIEESADRYAYHQGLFVIAPKGEVVKILNDKNFQPKIWD